ncbi:hypothetical protein POJ06DRAFT_271859 [Lipomyces tetrasporus]|uniref:Ubiquitin-like-conjugating enzyme ATG10 n=1 Tax=Lipomyces tetrasporus TaxID=54092 RepID=A0AAD7QKN4_9ASCO|nr:uncharacterized protein POJ06DRAFT_271859 [Lipomyces tetrasporus]KAJ8096839.1 hypothetical protein POJ06DRAFT_271859 [Lipomyces tetrasporus]
MTIVSASVSDRSTAKYASNFPYLTRAEFSDACQSFLPRLHASGLSSRPIPSTDKELFDGIEITSPREHDDFTVISKVFILLSPIYSLPVLYFSSAYTSLHTGESTPITLLEDVYKYLITSPWQASILKEPTMPILSGSGAISQCEHPLYHGLLCFYIHPCHTGDVMNALNQDPEISDITLMSYLALWIGVVGPAIGIVIAG